MRFWFGLSTNPERTRRAERALRHGPPQPAPDPDLHGSIMRAVRAARASQNEAAASRETASPRRVWLFPAIAAGACAAALLFLMARGPAVAPTASTDDMAQAPGKALDLGAQMPSLLVAPLTNQLALIDRDMRQTTSAWFQMGP